MRSSCGKGRCDYATQHSQGSGKGPNYVKDNESGAGWYGNPAIQWRICQDENSWHENVYWQPHRSSYDDWSTPWWQKSKTGSSGEWSNGSVGCKKYPAIHNRKSWTEMGSSGKGSKEGVFREKGRKRSTIVFNPVPVFRSQAAPLDSQGGSQPVPVPGGSQPDAQCGIRVAGKAYSRPHLGMGSETDDGKKDDNSQSAGSGDQQTQQEDGRGENQTQPPPANTGVDGSADTDDAASGRSPQEGSSTDEPKFVFQFLENKKGDVCFWQTVDDYMQQSLYDCLNEPEGQRTTEIWLYFGKPKYQQFQKYWVNMNDDKRWVQVNARSGQGRELRHVQVTPVVPDSIKGSQPIPSDEELWWQYQDKFGWKNVNVAANDQLLQAYRAGQQHVNIVHKWIHPKLKTEFETTYAYDFIGMKSTNQTSKNIRPARIVRIEEFQAA